MMANSGWAERRDTCYTLSEEEYQWKIPTQRSIMSSSRVSLLMFWAGHVCLESGERSRSIGNSKVIDPDESTSFPLQVIIGHNREGSCMHGCLGKKVGWYPYSSIYNYDMLFNCVIMMQWSIQVQLVLLPRTLFRVFATAFE